MIVPVITYGGVSTGYLFYWPLDSRDTIWTSDTVGTTKTRAGTVVTTFNGLARATTTSPGIVLESFKFMNNNSVEFADNSLNATSFSISTWIKPTIASGVWFSKGTGFSLRANLHLRLDSATAMTFGFYSDDLAVTNLTNVTNKWTHIVVTYNTTGNAKKIYQDGVLRGSNTGGGSLNAVAVNSIGRWRATLGDGFTGYIDEVRVYNRVLSQNDVNELYRFGLSKKLNE